MLLKIDHTTVYRFENPVPYGLQRLRLQPKENAAQHVIDWHCQVEGGIHEAEYEDHHRNHVNLVTIEPGISAVTIRCHGHIETKDTAGVIGLHSGFAPLWYFKRPTPLTKAGREIDKLVRSLPKTEGSDFAMLHSLSAAIRERVAYRPGTTTTDHSAEHALTDGMGVCQDHAHIFIAAARAMGFPARYVSGYLMMSDRVEQDATHAWAEAYVDGIGWVGFDVSNGISPDACYVKIATGLDYREAAPVEGRTFGTRDESLKVTLMVEQQQSQQQSSGQQSQNQ